jgi:hypothetical protein
MRERGEKRKRIDKHAKSGTHSHGIKIANLETDDQNLLDANSVEKSRINEWW